MNKIHTVVWSFSKSCWVVASELASSGKTKSRCIATTNDIEEPGKLGILPLPFINMDLFNRRALLGSAFIPFLLSLGWAPVIFAAGGDGIYINDGVDGGCSAAGDSGRYSAITQGSCSPLDKSTQTNRSLFYNPNDKTDLGATSLTLGNELFVNGGSTAGLSAVVSAGAHINTLDMRGTQILQLQAGTVSATSLDAVNGTELFNTANSTATAIGGGAALSGSAGLISAPSFKTTAIDAAGKASITPTTSTNVGNALTNLNNSLVNTAAVGVKYDDVNTKAKVTFNQGGASTTLSNVAAGTLSATSTDVVNGSQLNATNTSVTKLNTQLGNLVNSSGNQTSQLVGALGGGAQVDPTTGVMTGPKFNTTAIDAAGKASTTPTISTNVGDAVTNLNNSLVNTATVGVKYDDVNTKAKVTFNQGGASTTLSNVAAGTLSATSTDVVNGSQLNTTNTSVTNLNTQLGNLVSSSGNQTSQLVGALGGGAQVDPTTGVVSGPKFNTTAIDATGKASTTPTISTNVGDAVTNLNNSLVNTAAVGVKYDDVGTKTKVTFNPGSNATLLSNVAAGTLNATSTDAVNGSQLFA
ncbi:ESPR-type extended signal peptide-containing protein, partial [Pseudomonas sp. VB3]|uniref:ESPR-type extended signal peptide-containing protein n=1 Tax=Pseudomonas sp. VB3 TaxID=2994641 RepID=UPI0022EC8A33